MFNAIRDRLALRRWQKSEVGSALFHHGHEYFWKQGAIFGHFEHDSKHENCRQLHAVAIEILASSNPAIAARERIADYVTFCSRYLVIGMTAESKAQRPYADTPYITGMLRPHIREITEHVDDLGRIRFQEPDVSDDELADHCLLQASIAMFMFNGINLVRISIEKSGHASADWLGAFLQASMVHQEDDLRRSIGLPSILPQVTDSLVYMSFGTYVTGGEPDPLFAWCKDWPDRYLMGRGPLPEALTA